ncbi:MAG: DUF1573 domain-containing protein [Bacteroidales bacterium]
MKKNLFLILTALFSVIGLYAQNEFGGIIKFDKTIYDFGDILISDGPKSCQFKFTNISNKPIIIHNVITSCGCTDPSWTRKPVKPGENGYLKILFKNDQGPFPFDKSITVYVSSLDKPVMLRIRGIAHEKKKTLKELFSYDMGPFAMRTNEINIGQVEQGLSRSESIEVANLNDKPSKIEFIKKSQGLKLSVVPNPIPANSKATLSYSINTKDISPQKWGNQKFSFSVKVNGIEYNKQISISALIKENFSKYSTSEKKNGAIPQFNKSAYNFGTCKAGDKLSDTFTLKNIGKEDLILYSFDSNKPGVTYEYIKKTIPGGETKITLNIDTTGQKGEVLYIITIVTNSPIRPFVNLFVTGQVE